MKHPRMKNPKNSKLMLEGKLDPAYRCWYNMWKRVINDKQKIAYQDADICSEWEDYSKFKVWFDKNHTEGKQLDKDILGDGKLYSPETCCFVSLPINNFFAYMRRPYKPTYANKVYVASVRNSLTGKREYLGRYKNLEDALKAYWDRKCELAKELSVFEQDVRVKKVLLNLNEYKSKTL